MPALTPAFDSRARVRALLASIRPSSDVERTHWLNALAWVDSNAPLFRTAKPATPPKHLVSYFPVVDDDYILLVDHKNAMRWLPTGGHVEPDEDPSTTVVRELREELGLEVAPSQIGEPLLVTVTETVGLTSGHVDVSLWFPVHVSRATPLSFDASEFNDVRWFHHDDALRLETDPYLDAFLAKLNAAA
jgi:8-oxo-dGTP pyrophosphatase MutT (NUDIX family)